MPVDETPDAGPAASRSDLAERCAKTTPSREPNCVDETWAVFASPAGSDQSQGTRAAPVATLSRALELAAVSGKYVIACDGVYAEPLAIKKGVRLFGGFDCSNAEHGATWRHERGAVSRVMPSQRGEPLTIQSVAAKVEIEDFEFEALPAADPGESSVAALVTNAADVVLRRVRLTAGSAQAGLDVSNPGFAFPALDSLSGNSGAAGGGAKTCTCPDGSLTTGGEASVAQQDIAGDGQPAFDHVGGKGGAPAASCSTGGSGMRGAHGIPGADAPAVASWGVLTTSGFVGADGAAGGVGTPGQGGGGAGQPGGGGGGCGACGGLGGLGGGAGGSSIALISIDASVTLDCGILTAGDAGAGGSGAAGQVGQSEGGAGGEGLGNACAGGPGGGGGNGGSGAGAAGGVSVSVLYRGAAPLVIGGTTLSTGNPGAAGLGGTPGSNDGVSGVASALLQMP